MLTSEESQRREIPVVDGERIERIKKQLVLFEPTESVDGELIRRLAQAGVGGSY